MRDEKMFSNESGAIHKKSHLPRAIKLSESGDFFTGFVFVYIRDDFLDFFFLMEILRNELL